MRPTSTYPEALAFAPEARDAAKRRTLVELARAVQLAIADGMSAAHDYQTLTARGMAPDDAARRVFADHFEQH